MKLKYLMFALLISLLIGCGKAPPPTPDTRVEEVHHCATSDEKAQLAKFIVDCSTAANPKSDEEGEDLVAQCESTGLRTLCPLHLHEETELREYVWTLSKELPVPGQSEPSATVEPVNRNHIFYSADGKTATYADGTKVPNEQVQAQ